MRSSRSLSLLDSLPQPLPPARLAASRSRHLSARSRLSRSLDASNASLLAQCPKRSISPSTSILGVPFSTLNTGCGIGVLRSAARSVWNRWFVALCSATTGRSASASIVSVARVLTIDASAFTGRAPIPLACV